MQQVRLQLCAEPRAAQRVVQNGLRIGSHFRLLIGLFSRSGGLASTLYNTLCIL